MLVLAGFTPIPLKIFTWASGIVGVPMLPFLASMVVGRGKRVYLIALAIRLGGERAEAALHRYIEPIGWVAMALLAALIGWLVMAGARGVMSTRRPADRIAAAARGASRSPRAAAARVIARTAPRVADAARVGAEVRRQHASCKRGDTLYGIAFRNGIDVRDLAAWNGIGAALHDLSGAAPAPVSGGARRVAPTSAPRRRRRPAAHRDRTPTSRPADDRARRDRAAAAAAPAASNIGWRWPADGAAAQPLRRRRTDQAGHRHRRQRRRSRCARRAMAWWCIPARAWSATAS